MRKSIKQQIIDYLNEGRALCYGMANQITGSQSGYRRFQEILKDDPKSYTFIKVKSKNGGYYNVFAKKGEFTVRKLLSKGAWGIKLKNGNISIGGDFFGIYTTKEEAVKQIKKVVR